MSIGVSSYNHSRDYERVSDFLIRTYGQGEFTNWFQPTWEYMHFHPLIDAIDVSKFGIWEDGGELVAVAHQEHAPGEVFFQIARAHLNLKRSMLDFAEGSLHREENGKRSVCLYLDETDNEMKAILSQRGYRRSSRYRRDMAFLEIAKPFPLVELTKGLQLTDLQVDDDIWKVQRILHRGFDHSGEPLKTDVDGQRKMQSAPNFRKDLTVAVKEQGGEFVSYCGMWFDAKNRFAYIEPVATDPGYRRLGHGRACVLEAIRRCGDLGAKTAYVGSGQDFYRSMGFEYSQRAVMWFKEWT